jgi:hypothetical protein
MMVTKHTLFRPTRTETKADTTSSVARDIIAKETSVREAKVERLRKARLEREAFAAADDSARKPRKQPATRTKS